MEKSRVEGQLKAYFKYLSFKEDLSVFMQKGVQVNQNPFQNSLCASDVTHPFKVFQISA